MTKGTVPGRRYYRGRPALKAGEFAVLVAVEVPEQAFRPVALPSATLKISEDSLVAAVVEVTVLEPPAMPGLTSDPDYKAGLGGGES